MTGRRMVVSLAVILALVPLALGCTRTAARPRPAPPPSPKPLQDLRISVPGGIVRVPDPSGTRLWEAQAELLLWDGDRETARLTGVVCNFIEGGKVMLTARAPRATAYTREHRVVLEQGVQARSVPRQSSFKADRVVWNTASRKVYATGNVKFISNQFVTTAPALEADLELRQVRMKSVRASELK